MAESRTTKLAAKKPAEKKPAAKKPAERKVQAPSKAVARTVTARSPAALPKALAVRAKALHAQKQARLLAKGREAIARIKEAQVDIAANMVDIGLALADLQDDGVAEALGRASFAEVCELDVGMPISTANRFIALATKAPRTLVTSLGPDRAHAVLELMEATPEDDAAEALLTAKIALPSGRTLDVAEASTEEIRYAAKELRGARANKAGKRGRGFTATPTEKKAFTGLAKRLKAIGHEGAKLIATRDGEGAKVRFEVRLAQVSAFAEALRTAAKG